MKKVVPIRTTINLALSCALVCGSLPGFAHYAFAADVVSVERIKREFESYHQKNERAVDKKGRAVERRSFEQWDKQLRTLEFDLINQVGSGSGGAGEVRARMQPAKLTEAGVVQVTKVKSKVQEKPALVPAVEKPRPGQKKKNIDVQKMAAATQIGITAGQLEAFDARVTTLEKKTGDIVRTLEAVEQSNKGIEKRLAELESSRAGFDGAGLEKSEFLKARFEKIEGELARQAEVTASLNRSLEQMLEQQKASDGRVMPSSVDAPGIDRSELAALKEAQARMQAETRKNAQALLALQKSSDQMHSEMKSSSDKIEDMIQGLSRTDRVSAGEALPKSMQEMEIAAPATSEDMGNRARAAFQRFNNPTAPQSHDVEEFEDWEEFSYPTGSMTDDTPIAFVTAKKARLLAVPGQEDSLIASVPANSRLVVETRVGEWYRVLSPTGRRAWVKGDQIGFNDGYTSNRSALKIGGFDGRPSSDDYE
jgi:hypothetical protein